MSTEVNHAESIERIAYPFEERNLENKTSVPWDGDMRAKITKSILAMANLRDGGWIVIGKEERDDRTFEPVGMAQPHFDSFDPDVVKTFVSEYADPFVTFSIRRGEYEGKRFVLIRVDQFDMIPVICKRDYGNILHRGQVYNRPRGGKPESVAVRTAAQMREILETAIDLGVRKFFERISRVGVPLPVPSDRELFDKQLEGLR